MAHMEDLWISIFPDIFWNGHPHGTLLRLSCSAVISSKMKQMLLSMVAWNINIIINGSKWVRDFDYSLIYSELTANVNFNLWTEAEPVAETIASTPLKLFISFKHIIISIILLTIATRSSKFSASTIFFSNHLVNWKKKNHYTKLSIWIKQRKKETDVHRVHRQAWCVAPYKSMKHNVSPFFSQQWIGYCALLRTGEIFEVIWIT